MDSNLRSIPGVESVGATTTLALRGFGWTGDSTVEGRAADDFERELRHESVTPDYFRAMGTPLLSGRFLDDRDRPPSLKAIVVNEALERKYFRGRPAVGKRITFGRPTDKNQTWYTIVGVVADSKQDGMDATSQPTAYTTYAEQRQNSTTFVLRTSLDPAALVSSARAQVRAVDKDLVLTDVTTLRALVHELCRACIPRDTS